MTIMNHQQPFALMSWLIILTVALFPASCSDSGSFKVTGTVEGLGTQNLHIVYRDGNMVRSITAPAVDSKFEFQGNSPRETVVEVFNNLRSPLGCFVVKNGETVDITLKSDDLLYLKATGDKTSERLADFLAKNRGDSLNTRIASAVIANPADFLSATLLTCYYDTGTNPAEAAELIAALDYEKIPPIVTAGLREMLSRINSEPSVTDVRLRCIADSMTTVAPCDTAPTFYYFDDTHNLSDSTAAFFDSIPSHVKLVYILTAPDTLRWSKNASLFPSRTYALWAPDGVSEQEISDWDITSMPYIIVADSTGRPIYRGAELPDAVEFTKSISNK